MYPTLTEKWNMYPEFLPLKKLSVAVHGPNGGPKLFPDTLAKLKAPIANDFCDSNEHRIKVDSAVFFVVQRVAIGEPNKQT